MEACKNSHIYSERLLKKVYAVAYCKLLYFKRKTARNSKKGKNMFTEYEFYERREKTEFTRRCINGKITGCGKCVGFCKCDLHPGFLTRALRQKKNCIKKGCVNYVRKEKSVILKTVRFEDL